MNGEPDRLTCQTHATDAVAPGTAERTFDVLVVGGGPAGLAAAAAAAEAGVRVGIADDNPRLGGQIWRGDSTLAGHGLPGLVVHLPSTRIVGQLGRGRLLAEMAGGVAVLSYARLVLATGARELFLPFPGWTLPNVLGAGGLQALVKCGLAIDGKRVIVAGTGPLLLAVASYLKKRGAVIAALVEQAPWARVLKFGLGLFVHGKLGQALSLRWQLRGVKLLHGHWIAAAQGNDRLRSVTLTNGARCWQEPCDYLAVGYGLVPNTELAAHLGCELTPLVRVDERQETTVPGVFCAGEPTGIGGQEKASIEGTIAGRSATGRRADLGREFRQRARAHRFAADLNATFSLRDDLKSLPRDDTIVCRCEDVSWGQLRPFESWRVAKLQTRCGMGPCQGRICGPALAFLCDWQPESVRPPVFPARVETLAAT
jgi:NADPH-dependent 2,4-dienoyl-CoA reductase/sulfur reductase-like enzyme